MSPQGVYPAADALQIGDEISSTYEGRHITLYADNLSHSNALAVVTKGYPVWFGNAVGIAFETQIVGQNPLIAVDTEGIWVQDVQAADDMGNSAVIPGDTLYINTTTGLISKISNENTQIPFGYALGNVGGGNTDRIAVKVHYDPIVPEDAWVEKIFYGGVRCESSVSIEPGNTLTVDNVTTRITQGCTGLTVSDHPTFDYIVLTTSQGVTGLGVGDGPAFDHAHLGHLIINGVADCPLDLSLCTPAVADIILNNDQLIRNATAISTRALARALMGDGCQLGSLVISDDARATTKPDWYIKTASAGADTDWERLVTQAAD